MKWKRGDENLGAREKYFNTWIIGLVGWMNMLDKNKGLIFNVDDTRMKRRIVKWIKKKKINIFKIGKDRFVRNFFKVWEMSNSV